MVSEEGLNAYGAVTWGQFFVYQGFNEDTGWMHTSTYADFMDEFVEDVVRTETGLQYRYGEEMRPVEVSEIVLRYRDGDEVSTRTFPSYRTTPIRISTAAGRDEDQLGPGQCPVAVLSAHEEREL